MEPRALFLVALFISMIGSQALAGQPKSEEFQSGGETVGVEIYGPESSRYPVIVLHGAGGMMFDGAQVKSVALTLAEAGMTSYVVSYFDRTNTWFVMGDRGLIKGFPTWAEVVDDAVTWVVERSGGRPVGIYGYSLGGFLAVATASGDDRVAAAVTHSGGIWKKFEKVDARLPPILVVHGKGDERVYFDENTDKIRAVADEHGSVMRTMYFANEGHRFSDTAMARVRERTRSFLGEVLRSGEAR